MTLLIVVYVCYFSWMGCYIFAGTIEGSFVFGDFWTAFYNIFITLTTSNFPNVMLDAYGVNRQAGLFFIIYLVCGLFVLM